jgi:tRNA threonylcarbamoyladenosine biosynthesis protein TsaE
MTLFKDLAEKQVKKLAYNLGLRLRNADAVIGLQGNLGSGKTTFAKSLASALGLKKVKSPTFIVILSHKLGKKKFYHVDFYRLNNKKQLLPLGLNEIFAGKDRIVLIEWVDKFPTIKKQCDIIVSFKIKKADKRDVKISI